MKTKTSSHCSTSVREILRTARIARFCLLAARALAVAFCSATMPKATFQRPSAEGGGESSPPPAPMLRRLLGLRESKRLGLRVNVRRMGWRGAASEGPSSACSSPTWIVLRSASGFQILATMRPAPTIVVATPSVHMMGV